LSVASAVAISLLALRLTSAKRTCNSTCRPGGACIRSITAAPVPLAMSSAYCATPRLRTRPVSVTVFALAETAMPSSGKSAPR
jgi:hypothetical protein